jgi:anti-sigma factor RsiW
MRHIPEEVWKLYTEDALGPEERERCDSHLQACDACMDLYLRWVDQLAECWPEPDMERIAETVMHHWTERSVPALAPASKAAECGKEKRRGWVRHPIFHYAVAAAVTLLLMGSGVFQSFTQQANAWDAGRSDSWSQRPPSWSEQLMEQTIQVIAALQPKLKQEERRGKHDE